MQAIAVAICGVLGASFALAQGPGPANPQPQLNAHFQASGLAVGKAFPVVDIYDAAGKPFNTASLKGFRTVVVSGCLT